LTIIISGGATEMNLSYLRQYIQAAAWRAKLLSREEDGAALIEYTVLIGLMLVGVVVTITAVGTWVSGQWTTLNTAL
jgi:pilus assembly protein Flp/PilA